MKNNRLAVFIEGNYYIEQVAHLWTTYFHNKKQEILPKLSPTDYEMLLDSIVEFHLRTANQGLHRLHYYDQSILSWSQHYKNISNPNQTIQSHLQKVNTFDWQFMNSFLELISSKRRYQVTYAQQSPLEISLSGNSEDEESLLLEDSIDNFDLNNLLVKFNRQSTDIQLTIDILSVALQKQIDTLVIITDDIRFNELMHDLKQLGIEVVLESLNSSVIEPSMNQFFDWISKYDLVNALHNNTERALQKEPSWWRDNEL